MKKYFSSLLAFLVLFNSCKKMIELDTPPDQLTDDKVFSNDANVTAALTNIYASLTSIDGNSIADLGMYSDELAYTGNNLEPVQFAEGKILPTNVDIGNLWRVCYAIIYQCNLLLEGLNQDNRAVSETIRKTTRAEVKFVRAWCYFHLVNIFGEVPLSLHSDASINATGKKKSISEINQQIVVDLKEASTDLGTSYATADKVRANKWAATALLARQYFYIGDWTNARVQSDQIIQSSNYSLAGVNDITKKSNSEAIWQLWNQNGYYLGSYFVPASGKPTYSFRDSFLNSFEPGDNRKTAWTKTVNVSAINYTFPFKYKNNSTVSGANAEYTTGLRLAEQYLIRAEASTNKDDISSAVADINLIRTRAGLPNITLPITKDSCLKLVAKERKSELFVEGGLRFFDLKRTGKADEILSPLKPLWKPTAIVFPIPLAELVVNPALQQNPGY